MLELEPEELFDERGEPSLARPLLQGDVFRGVDMPGLDTTSDLVQVIAHPCVIRRGPVLSEHIACVPVIPAPQVPLRDVWGKHFRVVPLPNLLGDDANYVADLTRIASPRGSLLPLGQRLATLSHRGILMVQERLVRHMTRFEVGERDLYEASRGVLVEAEMQQTWIESRVLPSDLTAETATQEAAAFEKWLDDDERRSRISNAAEHAKLRRDLAAHLRALD